MAWDYICRLRGRNKRTQIHFDSVRVRAYLVTLKSCSSDDFLFKECGLCLAVENGDGRGYIEGDDCTPMNVCSLMNHRDGEFKKL